MVLVDFLVDLISSFVGFVAELILPSLVVVHRWNLNTWRGGNLGLELWRETLDLDLLLVYIP